MLGMPPVHGHHVDVGPWAWGDEGSAGLRVHPPILTGESRGTLATREPNGSRVRYGISPREHGGSAALRSLRRIRLESKKVGRMREEIQEEKMEMRRAHRREMEEMRRAFSLEMEEIKRALQLNEEGKQGTDRATGRDPEAPQ